MEASIRRRHPVRRAAAVWLCLLASTSGRASATSLQEAVVIAVTENPQVLSAAHDREAAAAQLAAARGAYLPRVDLNAGYAQEQLDSPTTRLIGERYRFFAHREGSLSVSQTLFDGFGIQRQLDRSRAALRSSDYTLAGTAEQVALDTIGAYLDVLRRQRTLALAQDNVDGHRQIREMIRLRVGAGVSRNSDLDQSDSRLALALSALRQEQGALADAESTYRRLVGRAPEALALSPAPVSKLPGVWGGVRGGVLGPDRELQDPSLPPLPESDADSGELPPRDERVDPGLAQSMIDTQTAAVREALDQHPALLAARQAALSAQAGIGVARAAFYPTLSTELASSQLHDVVRDTTKDTSVGVRLRMNLFSGGIDRANISLAAARHERALSEQQRIERQVTDNLSQAGFDLLTIRDRRLELARYTAATAKARQAYLKQYNVGQRSLLDLVNSQDEQYNARTAVANAEFTEHFVVYRVLQAMGRLLPALGVPSPASP